MEPTFLVNGSVLSAFLARSVPTDVAADKWPTDAPSVTSQARAVAEGILADVRQVPGLAVVQIDPDGLDDHELCTAAWNLFTSLCAPVPQYRTGELMCMVEIASDVPTVSHYSGSSRSGGHHTDGTLLPDPPEIAALLGLSAADTGGETITMSGPALWSQLDPAHQATFARPHHFDVMGQIPGLTTRKQPIAQWGGDNSFQLRYLRRYIEDGYETVGERLPDDLRAAMDAFDRISADETNQTPVLLRRGVILLWNNLRMLHGRRAFTEGTSRRRLRRMYGKFVAARTVNVDVEVVHVHLPADEVADGLSVDKRGG
ncbi:TauD/TfdA family dioxygenase [Actinocrispum wychmicini]|uniref:TfdA family taurine catabolism dioxygenase TauD n=1 Tax=Actinocrispum wychmicini TaxID=1213861 RepID=A0A4R2JP49_9PSEU|nr:TauD/TfdA family dioxygenase [Actinocrispum wychmicini]TCO61164.1 TfdA family taurine catabolism dioxygenase TauD [Actinocrispum wychmicini]